MGSNLFSELEVYLHNSSALFMGQVWIRLLNYYEISNIIAMYHIQDIDINISYRYSCVMLYPLIHIILN